SSGEEQKAEVQQALDCAHGFIRTQLGKKLKPRYVPQLRFKWDDFLEDTIYDSPETDSKDD
ncbi:MAG: ribosome-binding factor A, partial [Thermodesulfobacteriota bacterium]